MKKHPDSRRRFLKSTGMAVTSLALSSVITGCSHLPFTRGQRRPFRFAVASDLHFGQEGTNSIEWTEAMVSSLNREIRERGLDLVFINGDLVNDTTHLYDDLKYGYLDQLEAPFYVTKGNHDFTSEAASWKDIWGYPENHVLESGDLGFILADTSRSLATQQWDRESGACYYCAVDIEWLREQLIRFEHKRSVFVMAHIAQRKQGIQGWPKFGVGQRQNDNTEDAENVMTLIESHNNVKAVFHGHNHDELGCYFSGGKPYFFDSRIGGSWGNKRGYRIVEGHGDSTWTTYQFNFEDSVVMNEQSI